MEMNQVPLARPEWSHEEYFREKFKDVTVLICQRKTRDLIQLCLTSLLNHYPEIKVLVVDGNSQDDSVEWLRFMAAKYPNVKLWERPEGRNSHGETMHEAMEMIETRYVLLMDSDTIVRRGGFVEGMLNSFYLHWPLACNGETKAARLYAIGSLMLVTRKGECCGPPIDDADAIAYAHPSCSMYDVKIYRTLHKFTDHGAPCALNTIDAENQGYVIQYYPIDKYVQHLCGASWQEIPTVWNDDGDVQVRPLVTFIVEYNPNPVEDLTYYFQGQKDKDFNIVSISPVRAEKKISTYDRGVLDVSSHDYDIRFKVNGHYVCYLSCDDLLQCKKLEQDFISLIRKTAIINQHRTEIWVDGYKIIERKHWQKHYSIK